MKQSQKQKNLKKFQKTIYKTICLCYNETIKSGKTPDKTKQPIWQKKEGK